MAQLPRRLFAAAASVGVALICSCNAIFGVDNLDYRSGATATGGAGGATSSSSSSTSSSTSSSSSSTSSSSSSSAGGSGTGAANEPSCGDDVREGSEECDGDDFGVTTCESLGFIQGTLVCSTDCTIDNATCVKCGDCRSCTISECYRDVYWWSNSSCTAPYGGCQPCANWGPSNSTHADGSFFCYPNDPNSPYWNGGACAYEDVDYVEDCDKCGEWSC